MKVVVAIFVALILYIIATVIWAVLYLWHKQGWKQFVWG